MPIPLWLIKDCNKFIDVDVNDIEPHIPADSGNGKWEQVRIPYKIISNKVVEINDL